jgi:outer membrane immunogenic protein
MKKILLATVALSALVAAPAMAADLSRPAPPIYKAPPPVYAYSWTGCYIGANGGGAWVRKDYTLTSVTAPPFGVFPVGVGFGSHDASSGIGGVQAGCNYQVGVWVLGLQGGYDWTNASGNNANFLTAALSDQTHVKTLASVTGRVGYAWDRFLGYVKAGGASVRRSYSVFFGGGTIATASETRGGWTVGIGGEYAFLEWLTGFVEYDYYNFGSGGNTLACAGCGLFAAAVPFNVTTNINVFKVGLNFTMPGDWDPQRSKSRPR